MNRSSRLRNQRGITLITTLLLLLMFLSLGAFALQFSGLDFKITTNQATGTQTLYVAESGLMHAMRVINNVGITNFNTQVVANWSTLFPASNSIPNVPQLAYTVAVTSDGGSGGIVTSRAVGYDGSARVVQARIRMGPYNGIGALYLASDNVNPTFQGNAFEIDGNDSNLAGVEIPNGQQFPGIATRSAAVTSSVVTNLSTTQQDNVTGLGFSSSPLKPSVATSAGPSISQLDTLADALTALPGVVVDTTSTINNSNSKTYGSCTDPTNPPQITHLTASSVKVNGSITGCGILIVDGNIDILGTINFWGLIIVKGSTTISVEQQSDTTVTGNAMIVGSLWTGDVNVKVGGNATLDYSSAALNIAGGLAGNQNPMPASMLVTSWKEVF